MSTDDHAQIRALTENWALWRDAGDWDRFATLWHPDGRMEATWLQAGYEEFIRASRRGFENGVRIWHFLGGHTAGIAGDRAVAQTKMPTTQRADGSWRNVRRRVHRSLLRLPRQVRGALDPAPASAHLRDGPA